MAKLELEQHNVHKVELSQKEVDSFLKENDIKVFIGEAAERASELGEDQYVIIQIKMK